MDLEEEECCGEYPSPPTLSTLEKWSPSSHENENMELDPEMDVKSIFQSPNIVSAFSHENSEIALRLVTPESIAEIIDLFKTTQDRSLLGTIFQLFMSTNKALLQAVSEVSAGIDGLGSILVLEGDENLYRIGLATQVLTTCVKMWPGDVFEMMTKSAVLFPSILASLGKDSVLHCAMTLAQTPPAWFHTFLWGFLSAYVAGRIKLPPKPRSWNVDFPGITNCEKVELNSLQRQRVIQVICAFLKAFPDEIDFKDVMMKMIPFMASASHIQAEQVQLFELGMLLPSSPRLVERALDIIDERVEHHWLTEKALDYLSYAYDGEKIEPVVNFVFKILSPEMQKNLNPFVLRATTKLVAKMMEKAPYPRFFAKVTQHLIAYVWNRSVMRDSLLFRSVVLQIATIVGDTPSWDGWKQFEREVVEPFMLKSRVDKDVKISEENWDKLLVDKLMIQSSVIEMTVADRRPVYDNISDDDLSDSRSAESGSYTMNQSDMSDSDVIATPRQQPAPRKMTGSMRMDRVAPPLIAGEGEEDVNDGERVPLGSRAVSRPSLGPMSLPLGPQGAPPPEIYGGGMKPPSPRVRINTGSVSNVPRPSPRRRAKSMAHPSPLDDEKKKKECNVA